MSSEEREASRHLLPPGRRRRRRSSQPHRAQLRRDLTSPQVVTRSYRPFDDPNPHDPTSVVLGREELQQADNALLAADALLGAGLPVRRCPALLNFVIPTG